MLLLLTVYLKSFNLYKSAKLLRKVLQSISLQK
jgi:hypothetical protein